LALDPEPTFLATNPPIFRTHARLDLRFLKSQWI
jgi:hypothetical protein